MCLEFGLASMARKAEVLLEELEEGFGRGMKDKKCEKIEAISSKIEEKVVVMCESRGEEKMDETKEIEM